MKAEREQLCHLMDYQKLSLEACTQATQNRRLPLRVVVQVLFFEQLQLRTSIAGCFLISDGADDGPKLPPAGAIVGLGDSGWNSSAMGKTRCGKWGWTA